MINAAVIKNDVVTNVIYIDQKNMDAFIANGMELLDSEQIGIGIGDYREGETWYRNIEGVKTPLPIETGRKIN